MTMLVLWGSMALDATLGEPDWLWRRLPHPAVLMGRTVEALDAAWNRGGHRRATGVAAVALLVAGVIAIGAALQALSWAAAMIAAAILLAQRSLAEHVAAVGTALRRGLPEGRAAVAMIVGRDTAAMEAPEVARAAIESAAENLSDGVVAPAFWFAVAGLPGLLAYKAVNTADSTIGYRTPRHEAFGWAAARLDDVLNWVPARLTAALILLAGRAGPAGVARDAARHRSPNAGWPEAAMARVLDVALSGPRSYEGRRQDHHFVHAEGRLDAGPAEIDAAVRVLWHVWWIGFAAVGLAAALSVA